MLCRNQLHPSFEMDCHGMFRLDNDRMLFPMLRAGTTYVKLGVKKFFVSTNIAKKIGTVGRHNFFFLINLFFFFQRKLLIGSADPELASF